MINDKKQELLKKYFLEMLEAKDDKEVRVIFDGMKQDVYDDANFRHRYSDFFKWIVESYKENLIKDPGLLGENINRLSIIVKDEYTKAESLSADQKEEKENALRQLGNIEKFCDHLNLSLAEHEYSQATLVKLKSSENTISSLQSDFQTMQKTLKGATDLVDENDKKVKSLQLEFITILSIFAAIVIATAGGFSYITAAVASLDSEIPLHRTICVIAIAGFFLFNSVFILLYIISKITDKPIHTFCKKYNFQKEVNPVDTKSCQSCQKSCWFITKLRRRLPYVFWFNFSTAIVLLIVLIRWLFIYRSF